MTRPIGIFDSGLGGLTVLKHLAEKFPEESFCYLGDIARLPYGNKSPETIRKYGLQIMGFLKDRNVKAIIIACNSASSVFLNEDNFEGIPLLNVIIPGSVAALKMSKDQRVAVVGTAATVRSGAYKKTLQAIAPNAVVKEVACPLLVPLVEEGMAGDEIVKLALKKYLSQVKEENFKTLILGCTHYPVLKDDFKSFLGPDVELIESGEVLSERIESLISEGIIGKPDNSAREIELNITDLTEHFEGLATTLMDPVAFKSLRRVSL